MTAQQISLVQQQRVVNVNYYQPPAQVTTKTTGISGGEILIYTLDNFDLIKFGGKQSQYNFSYTP